MNTAPNSLMRTIGYSFLWLIFILGLTHFVGFAGHNSRWVLNAEGNSAGFGAGLAHGFLSVVALAVSLFNKSINVYEIHNTGFGYNAGFIMGLYFWFVSGKYYKKES